MFYNPRPIIAGLIGIALLLAVSCSGGGGGNPLAPSDPELDLTSPTGPDGLRWSQLESSDVLWGLYDIVYDQGEIIIEPVRSGQFTLNVLGFLQPPDGNPANLGITILDGSKIISEGKIILDVSITHPINIPKYIGFDTMGVLIGNGSVTFGEDPDIIYAGPNDLQLLNNDGYTRWMNPVEFTDHGYFGYTEGQLGTKNQTWTATINPYKYFANGLGADGNLKQYLDSVTSLRGSFMPGTTNTRRYEIQFPMIGGNPQVRYQYAIISHWKAAKDQFGQPISNPNISNFPPGANAQEAVYIKADTSGSTLFHDEQHGTDGGDLVINLTVYDWQGMAVLNGTGAINEINAVTLDSPDGLFANPQILTALDLAGAEISSGENSTTMGLNFSGLTPIKSGPTEILLAVYSDDPTSYGPNFGNAFPSGQLASYSRFTVDVGDEDPAFTNFPPEIVSIDGPIKVTCLDGIVDYTCVATDPNPGDTLLYQWELCDVNTEPSYPTAPTESPVASINWSDMILYPDPQYFLWFRVIDNYEASDQANISISKEKKVLVSIEAEDIFINNVTCDISEAYYEAVIETCEGDPPDVLYSFYLGFGDPPSDLSTFGGWPSPKPDNFFMYNWFGSKIGLYWLACAAIIDGKTYYSDPLIINRIDTPADIPLPPYGQSEAGCYDTASLYVLEGGFDCDSSEEPKRAWTLTQTPVLPSIGWVSVPNPEFYVDWSVFPVGTYYLWQRIGKNAPYIYSDYFEVNRVNSEPDEPQTPTGPDLVNCTMTAASYDGGVIVDCDGDPVFREWAIGYSSDLEPPGSGWVAFSGSKFNVDFSSEPSIELYVFQRLTQDWIHFKYSMGFPVVKVNAPPSTPQIPAGPSEVSCEDYSEYQAGEVDDCDAGDDIARGWGLSEDPDIDPVEWNEFSGTNFFVDWSIYYPSTYFLFQAAFDGQNLSVSQPLAVKITSGTPSVGAPTGPQTVSCIDTSTIYSEGEITDCDSTDFTKAWYLSINQTEPLGGTWTPYSGSTFEVDFSGAPSGDLYLFTLANDGSNEGISEPLAIFKVNTAPEKPDVPVGPTEINCSSGSVLYEAGEVYDCDSADELVRAYYISTNSVTPMGGTWKEFDGESFYAGFDNVQVGAASYLFQRVSDSVISVVSNSLAVTYDNTAPDVPSAPSGPTDVSCVHTNAQYTVGPFSDCDYWQVLSGQWAVSDTNWPPVFGWNPITASAFNINWSLYDQDDYFVFVRVTDGFEYSYSSSLPVTVGYPVLTNPPVPFGPTTIVCDDPLTTYIAGPYLSGCPGLTIVREWAINDVPTPPDNGWNTFTGNDFEIDPSLCPIGYVYLFQRASLDTQHAVSTALFIQVQPGALGTPDIPVGAITIDCETSEELYEMGTVATACDDTPLTREYQVQNGSGSPLTPWIEFPETTALLDWTSVPFAMTYRLLQRADDGLHVETSSPLIISYVNDSPIFTSSISGPTTVTCKDTLAEYFRGDVDDCDTGQTLTFEWAINDINAYPVSGWNQIYGTTFFVNYYGGSIPTGTIYMFQRVSDGVEVVYDPDSLEIEYLNSPPPIPPMPMGPTEINCDTLLAEYIFETYEDCNGDPLYQEWAINTTFTPPATGWEEVVDLVALISWLPYDEGLYFLYQRVSDGAASNISDPLKVTVTNSTPVINSLTCAEGNSGLVSDGISSGLSGIDMFNTFHFNFTVDDCDDTPDNYYAVTSSQTPPAYGNPAWTGPLPGTSFTLNIGDYIASAPGRLYVHMLTDDSLAYSTTTWAGSISMWDKIWLTEFDFSGDMWTENMCFSGVGSYTWSYDGTNHYLRLTSYGASSTSAVWSDSLIMPPSPGGSVNAKVVSYLNPALAAGLDNLNFSLLNETGCTIWNLTPFTGSGCSANAPVLKQSLLNPADSYWNEEVSLGLKQSGFNGCGSSNVWVDWIGIWLMPV